MDLKLLGSILLIVGTSVGAGMLALPIATAKLGFLGALILLFFCWFIMTVGAFLLLEVNLWVQQNSNIITMARVTIGPLGQIIAWLTYLLLLYSLLCAYISGGSDLFNNLLSLRHVNLPAWVAAFLFTTIFGFVVFLGIHAVDYTNRLFMFLKFAAFFILIGLLTPFVSMDNLLYLAPKELTTSVAVMVTITSFGYAAIIPSLRVYFAGDVKKLKKAIVIGSLIPLLCYIAWDIVIMGIIPRLGDEGLIAILSANHSTSEMVNTLSNITARGSITLFAKLFTSICVVTSFLGVGLCLSDFLADGLQLEKKGSNRFLVYLLTFFPPLLVVLFMQEAFVKALEYAGIYCVILLMLLPAWMVWRGRYVKHINKGFRTPGGKCLLIFVMMLSFLLIVMSFI